MTSSGLPRPVLPEGWRRGAGYAHGMSARGRVVVTAGQIGWNPATATIETDDFTAQAAQALANLMAVVRAAGGGPEHLVRLTWYITSRAEYLDAGAALGAAYRAAIGPHYPAMAVVVVSALLDPRARVEIEGTAVVPE
ncbi:MAG: RidA family protein [Gemmatimonadetes bacterium]|nr:RidA family protein [Gemmatimonadota bacterium]